VRLPLLATFALACAPETSAPPEPPPCTQPAPTEHPIDRLLLPLFAERCAAPELEDPVRLCRRLFLDLTGRRPRADEIASLCEGRSAAEIVDRLQASERYRLQSWRFWRNRLEISDVFRDPRDLKSLFAQVDDLHSGALSYPDFVVKTAAHPGFIDVLGNAEVSAALVFRAFLGRRASEFERLELATLYRPYLSQFEADREFDGSIYYLYLFIDPLACTHAPCSTELFGGGSVYLAWDTNYPVLLAELTPEQRAILEEPGRLLARQPLLYEAAADAILDRFLDWDDGDLFPRRPGVLLPWVRQALADHLRATGDFVATEKMLLTSLLYTQSSKESEDAPVWAVGPLKTVSPEMFIDSLAEPLGLSSIGTCDPRYPYDDAFRAIYRANQVDTTARGLELRRMWELQESTLAWSDVDQAPDFRYQTLAYTVGGCTSEKRRSGIAFGYDHELLVEMLCGPELFPVEVGDAPLSATLQQHMQRFLVRDPTPEEIAGFEASVAGCTGDCSKETVVRGICSALLGSAELFFY
jgi:hypothetical protein